MDKLVKISNKHKMIGEYQSLNKLSELSGLSLDVLVKMIQEASELENDDAQLILAKLHFYGDFVPANMEKAFSLFDKLAAKGNAEAHFVSIFLVILIFPIF